MPIRPPRLSRTPSSKFDQFRARGREAETKAILARDPEVKRQFEDIARQWFELAELVAHKK